MIAFSTLAFPNATLASAVSLADRRWISVEWEKHWHPGIEEPEVALPQHLRLLAEWMEGNR